MSVLIKNEARTGRAVGGAARMARLSPEQRKQLAVAAASARWQRVGSASKRTATHTQQTQRTQLVARMVRELVELRREREIIDRKINGLTQAVESYGGDVPPDPDASAA